MKKIVVLTLLAMNFLTINAFAAGCQPETDSSALNAIHDQNGERRLTGGVGFDLPIVDTKYGTPELQYKVNFQTHEQTVFAVHKFNGTLVDFIKSIVNKNA